MRLEVSQTIVGVVNNCQGNITGAGYTRGIGRMEKRNEENKTKKKELCWQSERTDEIRLKSHHVYLGSRYLLSCQYLSPTKKVLPI